jgi:hypothetical protein
VQWKVRGDRGGSEQAPEGNGSVSRRIRARFRLELRVQARFCHCSGRSEETAEGPSKLSRAMEGSDHCFERNCLPDRGSGQGYIIKGAVEGPSKMASAMEGPSKLSSAMEGSERDFEWNCGSGQGFV